MKFDHTSMTSLLALGEAAANLPSAKIARFNAFLMAEGLMRTWWFNALTVKLAARLKGTELEDEWRLVFSADEELNASAGKDFLRHLIQGKDAFDPESAGGFNGAELAKIERCLDRLGYRWHLPVAA